MRFSAVSHMSLRSRRATGAILALALAALATVAGDLPPARGAVASYSNRATAAFGGFMDTYWDWNSRQFFWRSDHAAHSGGKRMAPMWWAAQGWESLMDNYERTNSSIDRRLIDVIYEGYVSAHNGLHSDFNDDRGWWALAATHAFMLTHESRFLRVAIDLADGQWRYWDGTFGGGIWWRRSTKDQKNVATNAPAAMVNARLYRLTGRDRFRKRAIALFAWVDGQLRTRGRLDDRIERSGRHVSVDYSYNYGTYIGASLELYRVTGSKTYISKATSLADSAMDRLTTASGVLRAEGTGDGGGFKGIFVRNFRTLITTGAVPRERRSAYAAFLVNNAAVAWRHRSPSRLWGGKWTAYASPPVEVLTDMSAVALFHAVDLTH